MGLLKKVVKSVASPSSVLGAGAGFLTAGPAGAVIGGLAGAGMDYFQTEQARQQNKLNQRAIDMANAYDLKLWNMQNEYNSPKAQMARLAAAGLNPNLVYGGGNVTGNTTGIAGSNGSADTVVANRVGNALQLAQMSANLAQTKQSMNLARHAAVRAADYDARRNAYLSAQTEVMRHNYKWAKDHNLPVGLMPDAQRDIWQFFKSMGLKLVNADGVKQDIGANRSDFIED